MTARAAIVTAGVLAVFGCREAPADVPAFPAVDTLTVGTGSGAPLRQAWIVDAGARVYASPAVDDSTVVVGDYAGTVRSLDRATGRERWRLETDGAIEATPLLLDGMAVLGAGAAVVAVDVASGQEKWRVATGGAVFGSPRAVDGAVLVGSNDGVLRALDRETGEERWTYTAQGGIESSVLRTPAGLLVFGSKDEYLYALRASDRGEAWRFRGGSSFVTEPLLQGDVVMAAEFDGRVHALRAGTGEALWSQDLGGTIKFDPVLGDSLLFVVVADQELVALDPRRGTVRWRRVHEPGLAAPALDGERLLVGTTDGALFAVDPRTGAPLWAFRAEGELFGAPVVADDLVLLATLTGRVHALTTREDGAAADTARGPDPPAAR